LLPKYFDKLPKPVLMMLAGGLVVVLGGIDYATGSELAISTFYLLPIFITTWFAGKRAGLVTSMASTVTLFVADVMGGYPYAHHAIPYWNAGVRLGSFLVVVYTLSALRAAIERQEELTQFIIHDLRSPLGIILLAIEGLRTVTNGRLTSTQKELIEMSVASCNRMSVLIDSLLDLARFENGQMPLQLAPVNVRELIESSIEQVTLWSDQRDVTLTFTQDTQLELVQADPSMTLRVMTNLLNNALKFSPPQSTIAIHLASYDANTLAISVSDQGPGIPTEWANKVFDKFTQVEAHKTGNRVGSGLGLNFCRQAVEAQGGHIWLNSEVNRGTTVTFTLPITNHQKARP
jgi:signal transduction histidine kinase